MKLVVNAYLSILVEGVPETVELADRLGIGHRQLAEVIECGPLDAPLAGAKLPVGTCITGASSLALLTVGAKGMLQLAGIQPFGLAGNTDDRWPR